MASRPNTVKFMNRMISEYRQGLLNDKQVCSSIRRITNLNEKQQAYCDTRTALKMFNKMPMNYQCKEPCEESAEETLLRQERRHIHGKILNMVKRRYSNYEKLINTTDEVKFCSWVREIQRDIHKGRYGRDVKEYLEG